MVVSPAGERNLKAIGWRDRRNYERVMAAIRALVHDPRPPGVRKLSGRKSSGQGRRLTGDLLGGRRGTDLDDPRRGTQERRLSKVIVAGDAPFERLYRACNMTRRSSTKPLARSVKVYCQKDENHEGELETIYIR